ncbi:MAG: zinc ribbon domain-containing protein [Thermoanaerobaculia bacterium]
MRQIVERLWELQTVLSQLAETERALSDKPESYAAVERDLGALRDEIAGLTQKKEDLGKRRRQIDAELQSAQETLKKFQAALMQVKNQTQYAAAWKEIDTARRQVKELEDAELAVMTELEEIEKELAARGGREAELVEVHDREYEQWQGSLGDLRRQADETRAKAEEIEAAIPDALRRQFHQILRQRQGVAVARVVGQACGECRVRLRAQSLQQLRRGEVVTCDGCRRFYYLEKVAS